MIRIATRHERVILELDDRLSTKMAKAAAATALLDRNLNDLDGSSVGTNRSLSQTAVHTERLSASMRRGGADIDSFSGRLGLLASAAGALGPALIPISAVAVPALTGLASQLAAAGLGAGSLVIATRGVGDALKAVSEAAIEPTTANLEKAAAAMAALGPEAQKFVSSFQEIRPALMDVRDAAAAGWFPGLTEALGELESGSGRVADIMYAIGEAGGQLVAEGAEALNGPQWVEFMEFVQATAPAALDTLGRTIGNVVTGLAELWMAFDPLNQSFTDSLLDASRSFADWSENLSSTEGFRDFVDYLRTNGPRVADALGSIATAAVDLVQAFAPLGGPVLSGIAALADAISAIANSPIGPPLAALVTAMSAIRLAGAAGSGLSTFAAGLTGIKPAADGARLSLLDLGKQMGIIAGLAYSASTGFEVVDSFNRYRDAADATAGSVDELAQAFADSNVGAAAKDFDIDLQRLAADLVENGTQGEYYTEVVTRMSEANKGLGGTLSGVTDLMGPWIGDTERAQQAFADLNNIIENNGRILGGQGFTGDVINAALAIGQVTPEVREQEAAMKAAANAAKQYSDALAELNGWLDKREALRGYDDALKTLTKSLQNGFTRKDQENVDAFGRSIQRTYDTIQGRGRKAEFLQSTIASLKAMQSEAGPKAQAVLQQLINKLKEIDRTAPEPKFKADPSPVTKAVAAAQAALRRLDGDTATTYIRTVRIGALGEQGAGPARADDGGIATGGLVQGPGTGTSDSIPAWISNGEYVIKAAAVDKYGPSLLHSINAMRFANGGLVANTYSRTDIGTAASLDINPFASSLHDLTQIAAQEYDSRALQLDRTDKQFAKILEDRAERARKEADADKSRLKAMIETQRAFEEQVSGLFKSDVFQKGETQWVATFPDGSVMELGTDVDSISGETGAYLAQAGATITQQSGFDPLGGLQGDIANIEEAMRLYQELRARGFDGPAFRELAASADVATLQQMAAMTNAELQQTERLFEQRDQLAGNLGQQVGQDFNPELKELRREFQTSNQIARRMEQKADRANQRLDNINTRLTSMERTLPANTGAAVGAAVNGASANGAAGRGGSAGGRGGR